MEKDKKVSHPFITNTKNCVFTQPFWDKLINEEWNEEMPEFKKRIDKTKDDRSSVLLIILVIEFHIDKLLEIVLLKYSNLRENKDITFSLKIDILRSINLIPKSVLEMTDCLRKIRNEFAHNLKLDNIEELKTLNNRSKSLINQLDNLFNVYLEIFNYKNKKISYIDKFELIAFQIIFGLRGFEPNLKAFREYIDSKEFEEFMFVKTDSRKHVHTEYK